MFLREGNHDVLHIAVYVHQMVAQIRERNHALPVMLPLCFLPHSRDVKDVRPWQVFRAESEEAACIRVEAMLADGVAGLFLLSHIVLEALDVRGDGFVGCRRLRGDVLDVEELGKIELAVTDINPIPERC